MFIQYVMINILFQDMWLYKIHRVESQWVIKKQLAINQQFKKLSNSWKLFCVLTEYKRISDFHRICIVLYGMH